jgi:hypothetical protein
LPTAGSRRRRSPSGSPKPLRDCLRTSWIPCWRGCTGIRITAGAQYRAQIGLIYLVPYCVSTYAGVQAIRDLAANEGLNTTNRSSAIAAVA